MKIMDFRFFKNFVLFKDILQLSARNLFFVLKGEFFFASSSLLPKDSISGRSLVIIIAIMTFLAGLTAGALHLVINNSKNWSSEISREMTIQIRVISGRDIDKDIQAAVSIAEKTKGVESIRLLSLRENEKLLEPWLGSGLNLKDLPVPRLLIVRLNPSIAIDSSLLKSQLANQVPNAIFDDHRLWVSRLRLMANSLIFIGSFILLLVIVVTALTVAFATRGAMAETHHIIDVLHLVGARDIFIAREFQRHFLKIGLKGGVYGASLAVSFYFIITFFSSRAPLSPESVQMEALFGRFDLSLMGYFSIIAIGFVVAVITSFFSRITVYRSLRNNTV